MKILLGSIYPFAFALLLFIVPFDDYVRALPNILLIILAITYPFIITKEDFSKLNKKGTLILLAFVFSLLLSTLINGNWKENLFVLEKVGIAVGVLLLYLPISQNSKLKNAIIFSSLAAVLYSVFNIFMLIKNTGTFDFGENSNPLHTLLIDRLYLGFLSILSILISYKSLTKNYSSYNRYHLTNIVVNILFIFLIVARMAILTLIVLAVVRLFYNLQNKKIVFITLAAIVIVVIGAFTLNDNLSKRFLYLKYGDGGQSVVERMYKQEPRTIIWACAKKIIQEGENILLGSGFTTTEENLIACYASDIMVNKERQQWFLARKYNSHNQFIDIYLSAGIVSFVLFVSLFVYLFFKHRKNFFLTAIVISIVSFGLIENFLHRQIGGYYFGAVLIFLLLHEFKNPEKLSENE